MPYNRSYMNRTFSNMFGRPLHDLDIRAVAYVAFGRTHQRNKMRRIRWAGSLDTREALSSKNLNEGRLPPSLSPPPLSLSFSRTLRPAPFSRVASGRSVPTSAASDSKGEEGEKTIKTNEIKSILTNLHLNNPWLFHANSSSFFYGDARLVSLAKISWYNRLLCEQDYDSIRFGSTGLRYTNPRWLN